MTWVVLAAISLLLTISYGIVVKGTLNNKKTDYDPIAYASAMFIFVGLAALVIWLFSGTISRDLASLLDPKIGLLTLINVVVDGSVGLDGLSANQSHQPGEERAEEQIEKVRNSKYLHVSL